MYLQNVSENVSALNKEQPERGHIIFATSSIHAYFTQSLDMNAMEYHGIQLHCSYSRATKRNNQYLGGHFLLLHLITDISLSSLSSF